LDYIPDHFEPYEVVPREVYNFFELRDQLYKIWWLFDPRILKSADKIREHYDKKMVINTWWWDGSNQYRGWRPPGCNVGARYSQHRFGRALDIAPVGITAEEIRQDIKAGNDFGWITCIEDNVSWLHIDCRNYQGLLIVRP
jgi:hypothetical protein